ncbi:MAG: hypothetical protein ACE5E7_13995 [Anaerolineae bacterium]
MQLTTPIPHKTIDLSGLRCPHLIIAIIHALETVEHEQIMRYNSLHKDVTASELAYNPS